MSWFELCFVTSVRIDARRANPHSAYNVGLGQSARDGYHHVPGAVFGYGSLYVVTVGTRHHGHPRPKTVWPAKDVISQTKAFSLEVEIA